LRWIADIELSPHKKLIVEGLVFPSKAGNKPFQDGRWTQPVAGFV